MSYRRLLPAMIVAGAVGVSGCSDAGSAGPGPSGSATDAKIQVTDLPDDRWTRRAAAPVKRTEVGAGVLGGRVWVLGGFADSGEPAADVSVYDPGADAWVAGPRLPEAVHHPAATGDGGRLWIVGGYVGHGSAMQPTDAVRFIDATSRRWQDGPRLPAPRAAGALAWDGKRLVFGGGVGPDGVAGDVFALQGDRWQRIGALSTAREHLAAASDGQGNTWFLAGRLGGLDTNRSDVDLVVGDRVARIGAVPTARGGVAGFHVPGRGGCVAGGEQPAGTFVDVECINADGATTALPSLGVSRHGLGAVALDGVVYTLLGGPSPGLSASDTIEALRVAGH